MQEQLWLRILALSGVHGVQELGSLPANTRRSLCPKPSFTPEHRQALAELIQTKDEGITAFIQRERQQRHPDQDRTLDAAQRATALAAEKRQAFVELGYLQIRRNANMSTQSTLALSGN